MLAFNLAVLGAASFATAINFPRAGSIDVIPAACSNECTTYKQIFSTCPGNPSDAACSKVCNGTLLTDLQVCINCALVQGPPAGVEQWQIDQLNVAQQQLAQECIDDAFPESFTGTVPAVPTSVAYPSGVVNATYAPSNTSSIANPASSTASPSGSASGSGSAAPSASASGQKSGATLNTLSAGALGAAVVLGAALVL